MLIIRVFMTSTGAVAIDAAEALARLERMWSVESSFPKYPSEMRACFVYMYVGSCVSVQRAALVTVGPHPLQSVCTPSLRTIE